MPLNLPDIEDIYSQRYYLDYEGAMGKHTMLFRFAPSASEADCKQKIINVVTAWRAQAHTSVTWNVLRYSAPGSHVSFPTTWTPIVGTHATAQLPQNYPAFLSVVGRDSEGRRARMMMFGVTATPDTDYRYHSTDHAQYAAIITAFKAATPTPLVSKGGLVVFWNDYVNSGYHAYFQRKRRQVA